MYNQKLYYKITPVKFNCKGNIMLFELSQSQQLFSSWLKPSLQYRTFLKKKKKQAC